MDVIRRYFAVTWSARTWRANAYLLLGLPMSIVWFTYLITMYALGVGLVVVWIGVVILAVAQWTLRPIGHIERGMANAVLGAGIVAPPERAYRIHAPGGSPTLGDWGRWGHALLHDGHSWRVSAWVMARIVMGPVGFALAIVAIVVPITLVAAWVIAVGYSVGIFAGPGADDATAQQVVDTVAFWVLVGTPVLALMVPMFVWVAHFYTRATLAFARWALGPCGQDLAAEATARAELAETQVRIDQELHDSIGHMITMNIVQAGAGAHVFDSDPEFARQALRNIEERGRVAMGELDRIIAAIRGDDAGPRAPLPALEQLPSLVDQARAAGLEVDAVLHAEGVPAALGRAGYAIVREALTNAARHSPGAPIHLHTETLPDALAVAVRNGRPDGSAPAADAVAWSRGGRRHGLAGIRDRVTLLGGLSTAGPTDGGGFEVRALIPLEVELGAGAPTDDAQCCEWRSLRATVVA